MEFIKDTKHGSLLVNLGSEANAEKIVSEIQELIDKAVYEDDLGLCDVADEIVALFATKNYLCVLAELTSVLDLVEETVKKLISRLRIGPSESTESTESAGEPVTESKKPGELDEAIKILEMAGVKIENGVRTSQIKFDFEPLGSIMSSEEAVESASKDVMRSVLKTIKGFHFPKSVNVRDLMFYFKLAVDEDRKPYFIFSIVDQEKARTIFVKAFSADKKVDSVSGLYTMLSVPGGFLSQVLIEFVDNL